MNYILVYCGKNIFETKSMELMEGFLHNNEIEYAVDSSGNYIFYDKQYSLVIDH